MPTDKEPPADRGADTGSPGDALERVRGIVSLLRRECGWTSSLTPEKLTPYLVEEAEEVREAVETNGTDHELVSELGDILFQILLHAELGRERGAFDLEDIADALAAKLLRRNTHLFQPDGSLRPDPQRSAEAAEEAWAAAKRREREESARSSEGPGTSDERHE